MSEQNEQNSVWYTRCPVPSVLSVAAQLGWLEEDFAEAGFAVRSIRDNKDPAIRESHFDHRLAWSFRQGGNVPPIWTRSKGTKTRLVALSWVDEFQAIVALPSSGIRQPADLAGRRVGIPKRLNGLVDFNRATSLKGVISALSLAGLNLDAVAQIELGIEEPILAPGPDSTKRRAPYAAEIFALIEGRIDAFFVKGAEGIGVVNLLGAAIVADLGNHPDPAIRLNSGTPRALTVDETLAVERPDLVERLLALLQRTADWATTHPAEIRTFVAREIGASEDAVAAAFGPDLHKRLGVSLDPAWVSQFGAYKNFLRDHGFLAADFALEDWIDPAPLGSLRRRAVA